MVSLHVKKKFKKTPIRSKGTNTEKKEKPNTLNKGQRQRAQGPDKWELRL